ncbi:unnamed protein product [Blepharisma stoltei]|uniref:Uncharacterized protein n=1 Tax=Blepharisma stoltei TaxID=1481888 RepID=A0AAU9I9P2_9CILI|nr:unnamed protein product [Blepharisma stoltei]
MFWLVDRLKEESSNQKFMHKICLLKWKILVFRDGLHNVLKRSNKIRQRKSNFFIVLCIKEIKIMFH